jgi:hypothetical protein
MGDRKYSRGYKRHGLDRAKRALEEYGTRAIDGPAAREMAVWRDALVADLGGEDAISTQQLTVIDLAVRTKLLLDGIDAWLLSQNRAPVNMKSHTVWNVVKDRQRLSDSLSRYMEALGLEKRQPPAQDLTAYIEEQYAD